MLSSRNVTTRWLPCTPVFNIDTDNEHRPTQTDSPSSIIDPISNDPPGQSVLNVPSCTISLSLSVWPRYSYREEHEGRRSFARKSSLEAIRPPEDGAHQREPNFLPSFIDANILFDSDLLETRHVRRVETTFHGHGKARRVSRETETPPLSLPSADNRISNSRRTNFVELARPFLLNDIVSIFWSCIIRIRPVWCGFGTLWRRPFYSFSSQRALLVQVASMYKN